MQQDFLTGIGAKTAAQIILRWHVQRGVAVIPKSVHESHIAENFNVFDFSLSQEEMDAIATMDTGKSDIINHHDPEVVRYLTGLKIHD